MLVTHGPDPRSTWRTLMAKPAQGTPDEAALRALPAGARPAPLEWLCTTEIERVSRFDRDEQGEVFYDQTNVTGWRAEPDPRVRFAGELSFHGIERLAIGMLSSLPDASKLGSITALTVGAQLLGPGALERIGHATAWEDLSIWAAQWSPPARAAGMRELATSFPALRGLELHTPRLDDDDVAALAGARFLERLEDLTLTACHLGDAALTAIEPRLGSLAHLDLRDSCVSAEPLARLAPRLTRARRLQLSGNPLGDAGLRALLEAGALDHVEDLWLGDCELGDASARALAEASPPRLRGLWIHGNRITDAGLAALVRAPLFARLEGAYLSQRALTERSRTLLEGHPLAGALDGTTRLPGVTALWFLGRPA